MGTDNENQGELYIDVGNGPERFSGIEVLEPDAILQNLESCAESVNELSDAFGSISVDIEAAAACFLRLVENVLCICFGDKKLLHLARHHRKARIRKKNRHRLERMLEKQLNHE